MSAANYLSAIEAVGINVVVGADLGDYQGDWVGLVSDYLDWSNDRFGFLVIGYGSCSGCDAWEAASTALERAEITRSTVASINWFDSFAEAQAYITSDNDELQWYGYEKGWDSFKETIRLATENLRNVNVPTY